MARSILIDELHIDVFVPRRLPERDCAKVRRTLLGRRFLSHVRRAMRDVFQNYRALVQTRITVSR